MDRSLKVLPLVFAVALLPACQPSGKEASGITSEAQEIRTNNDNIRTERKVLSLGPDKLSEYNLFAGNMASLEPAERVYPYGINMPLFSDYASKSRFVYLPEGSKIKADADGNLHFPNGTRLIKTFFYPSDIGSNRKLLETRIIEKKAGSGEWSALTYIWNDEQTEAFLEVAGGNIDIEWVDSGVLRKVDYSIPNVNQCKTCHGRAGEIQPLGPKLAQLRMPGDDSDLISRWQQNGILELEKSAGHPATFPTWENRDANVQLAARAYLDSNCGSCHHPQGSANTSGLFLTFETTRKQQLGVLKKPVAAGKGSGGRLYSIVPGRPEESILVFRMQSTDPGIMMPELGRSLAHEEGIELIKKWITEFPATDRL